MIRSETKQFDRESKADYSYVSFLGIKHLLKFNDTSHNTLSVKRYLTT